MPRKSNSPSPEPKRLQEYHRALAAFSRIASEVLPTERLLHYVTAQVSRVTHIRHVKVMRYPGQGSFYWSGAGSRTLIQPKSAAAFNLSDEALGAEA